MRQYLPAILTGLAVYVLSFFCLRFLEPADGILSDLMSHLLPLSFGMLTVLLMGCLVGTKRAQAATSADKAAALTFRPEPDQALLIVFREGFLAKVRGLNVALDDRVIAQLKSPRFTALSIAPGSYGLTAGFTGLDEGLTKAATQDFSAAPGEVVAFRLGISIGMVQSAIRMQRIDAPETLASKLKSMPMIAPLA